MSDALTLLDTSQLLALPPPVWLMDTIIPAEELVLLYGEPENGKSFVALDWAMSISEGMPWLDLYNTKQAPVVYIAAEGGRGIQKRVRAWMKYHGLKALPNIYWLLEPLYVREDGEIEAFLVELERHDVWPGLIVIDTLSRSFGGGEENSSADMGQFVQRIAELARGRRTALLVVHHTNKIGKDERGHTSLRGAMQTSYKTEVVRNPATKLITRMAVHNTKQKDDARTATIWVAPVADPEQRLGSLVFEPTEAPAEKEPGTGVPQPMRKQDMLTLLASHPDGLTKNEWMLAAGVPKHTFYRRVKRLMTDTDIYRDGERYFATPATEDLAALADEED